MQCELIQPLRKMVWRFLKKLGISSIHIYYGILLSHKKKHNWSFVETWIDLESVMKREVRKRKTNIVY